MDDVATFQPPTGYYIEDLSVGMSDRFGKTVTEADIVLFSGVSGDTNPVHLDEEYAARTRFKGRITHGMLNAGFISAVLGTRLPGPGSIYVSQNLKFRAPVRPGDTVEAVCTVKAIDIGRMRVTMDTVCRVRGTNVITGEAVLLVPSRDTVAV
ncbi:MaoC family dehydratase [Fodinicurvata sp. EGI_FJ10296]|uniref:MaoC family dehydratase n=1 Tax=Fodinicurvata sp. EGI_FJ10296 TaxID=3231908 RepID=UPI003455370B